MTSPSKTNEHQQIIDQTRQWLEQAVIGLNLCPFAKAVHANNRVQYVVSEARRPEELVADLQTALLALQADNPEKVETTLLIHPWILNDFLDYNDFLDVADAVVEALDLAAEIQIASFHPHYQFAETAPEDIGNYSNRSPYPTLHLLRQSSVDRAVEVFPDASAIFENNIATLNKLGHAGWKKLFPAVEECLHQDEKTQS